MVMDLRENFGIFLFIVVIRLFKGTFIYRLIPTAIHNDEDIDTTLAAFEATKRNWIREIIKVEAIQIWLRLNELCKIRSRLNIKACFFRFGRAEFRI